MTENLPQGGSSPQAVITFDAGTLVLDGVSFGGTLTGSQDVRLPERVLALLSFDGRIGKYRCQAHHYAAVVRSFYASKIPFSDAARAYTEQNFVSSSGRKMLPHQRLAMQKWLDAKKQGVAVLPTGSGKTFLAFMAMSHTRRSTIIMVPTIDLMQQWASQLEKEFKIKVGMLGGGSHDVLDVTVATYDSATLNMEFIGNRFGLAVFDECHHLPAPATRSAASMCLAPFRLGLTATPERQDGGDVLMEDLIGDVVCRIHIDELEGSVLAPYVTRRVPVRLTPEEKAEYDEARKKYLAFVRACGIDFSEPDAWTRFMTLCAVRRGGRDVFKAYLRQKHIAHCSSGKLDVLWKIIREHPDARTIVFTADNDTAYAIGEKLCLPVLTHKTKAAERKDFLDKFRSGEYPCLVTSRVLNEGVDVPEANVAVVVSGSAGTREHVQRLGRILRRREGKQAVLYELVSADTSEMSVSERRRSNRAYAGHSSFRRRF